MAGKKGVTGDVALGMLDLMGYHEECCVVCEHYREREDVGISKPTRCEAGLFYVEVCKSEYGHCDYFERKGSVRKEAV